MCFGTAAAALGFDQRQRKRRPRMAAMIIGRASSDRAVAGSADRAMLARYEAVIFGVRVDSTEKTTWASTVPALLALNPDIIILNYQCPWETAARRITLTRSGSTVTASSPDGSINNLVSGRTFAIRGSPVSAYNGEWLVTGVPSSSSFTFTISGSPANDSSLAAICLWNNETTQIRRFKKAGDMGWFVQKTHPSGARGNPGPGIGVCVLNLTAATPADSDGLRGAQWYARLGHDQWLNVIPGVRGLFQDNVLKPIRFDSFGQGTSFDWNRDGSAETREAAYPAVAAGLAGYATQARADAAARTINKVTLIFCNSDAEDALSDPSLTGVYDGSLIEDAMPLSSSKTVANRATRCQNRLPDLRHKGRWALLHADLIGASSYALARSSLACNLIINDGPLCVTSDTGYDLSTWHDEYGAPIGVPIEPRQAGPRSGTVWYRRYSNGIAIINGSTTASATVNVAALGSYRKMAAADTPYGPLRDPTFNNGAAVSSITLAANNGCVLLRA